MNSSSYQGTILSDSEAHLNWQSNLDEAFVLSKKEDKPLFVDFTGYTCVNCRWMEKNTFKNPDVYDRLKNRFITVRLYTDGGKGHLENQRLQVERFKTIHWSPFVHQ